MPLRERPSRRLHVCGISISRWNLWANRVYLRDKSGPFELTKLSAQISVLMARSSVSSVDDTIRRSYQQKGTLKTAANIIRYRGVLGLYSGFHLHLCKYMTYTVHGIVEGKLALQNADDEKCATHSAPLSIL